MKALRRIVFEEAAIAAAFLTALWYAYYLTAVWGLQDHFQEGPLKSYMTGPGIHLEMILSGLGFGIAVAVVSHLSDVPRIRERSLGQIILLKTAFYLVATVVVAGVINALFLTFLFSPGEWAELFADLWPRLGLSLWLWFILSILAANFLLEVRRKIGPGNLWALLSGRYHRPREEERIFLFLDLKGSTGIAEQLGHSRYSQFLRACYHDLTEFILLYRAEIYQFVGDGVVLTWPAERAGASGQSLQTFFAFQSRLQERQDWYQSTFGATPEFRGGVEGGVVTATEVGDIKREIAFHGDPLNTAARLLELCREYERPVLVSGRIKDALSSEPALITELKGEIILRGKTESVSVFGVTESPPLLA